VQLVRILDLGPGLVPDPLDSGGIQSAEIVGGRWLESAPGVHGLRPALLCWGVVQKRVWSGVQNLMGERGGLRQIAGHQSDLARMDAVENALQSIHVHDFVHTVIDGLAHQRMIGYLPVAGNVLQACRGIRKCGSEEILRLHPLNLWRGLTSAPAAWDSKGDVAVPAPVGTEHWRVEQRLNQNLFRRIRMEKPEYRLQRERMLGPQ
jgi:hypothetical protein